ncbi:regulator [Yersinia kristensenii]|uniref:regulator n=1 Tax=Yersinia kristensenii TaxID=28152 RepID=UPI0011AAA428|nr:regulator [Yersinia kristensenii]MBW5812565.1 regulator [Yersinia kristensenii]MBW5817943.1 regulator [Yersinia kristensenii]MBW5829866.1 regulator [Yersinia kristensenii]MBW5842259.1 regulator [Yersinia kristensenii]MDA5490280.1 regulator [Yersinia kristensenii]
MNNKPIIKDENDDFECFLSQLNGDHIREELDALSKSKKITITQLKSIYSLGVRFYSSMQLKEAEAIFISYSALCPYDHRGPGCLAAIYLEKNDFKKSLDILNVMKTYPTCDLDEVFINISLCHYKLKEYTKSSIVLMIVKNNNLSDFYYQRYQFLKQQLSPYI